MHFSTDVEQDVHGSHDRPPCPGFRSWGWGWTRILGSELRERVSAAVRACVRAVRSYDPALPAL
jgi:hypothetical protein